MLKSEAAAYLAGVTQTEGAEASAPTNLHVITGEVGEASADGKTLVKIDGLMFSESDDQFIEVDALGGLEEGDIATIVLTGEQGHAMTPLALGSIGSVDRITVRIAAIEADYIKVEQLDAAEARIGELEADHVSVDDLDAATARIGTLETTRATVTDLEAATARIHNLEVDHVSIDDFEAEQANIDQLQADTADIGTIRANSAKVQNLTAAQLEADHATVGSLSTTYATIANLNAANGRITNLESTKANISDLEADYITADEIEAAYMHANMSNSDVAWIENGTIKNGAIVSAMINDVSANKLTAGTINGSVINVTNLNADNITTGTINGQRIGEGSLSLSKLEDDVYTESEVDAKLATMQAEIDGAIETWTGTAVPTLNNSPASNWKTAAVRDTHVGDVYFVVNSQSQQNGYNYRFTKSGSTYSWQLIKDSDVTNALQRLETAEGKITTFDSDISTLKTDTGSLTTRTTSLETRMSDAEDDILDKVDTTTFNEVSDTVDQHSQTISQHTTAIANKADSSTVTAVTNRVSKNEQDISGINTTIGELQETVEAKADGSTVTTISNKLNTVSDTVDGHTQTLTSVQNTLSNKADSSTVSTLTTKVNNVSDTVDGHTSQLSSITTTQTTMQGTLDKTVKSSIQLWYSKANTTAPSKPTSRVTSTSTSGNAWRIVVPAYNSSYPHYYYCWQYEYADGTYGWSAVVRDIAMGESQSTARTADSNASAAVTTANTASTNASTALTTANTANTNASDAKTAATTASTTASEAKTTAETAASDASTAKTNAASAVSTANSASTTATNAQNTANANIKSSVQLWFTKANSTAPSKPTSVVSTSNANTANAWNLVVPVWNKNYPHYFYCYQQQKGNGNYQWTDVVYDRATSEAQQLANTTSTSLTTLQEDYATYKQTTTANVSSIGTRLTTAEGKISTAETAIEQNSEAIALKANSSDIYTKTAVDGKITQEVSDRNAAITAKANEITSTVSQTYTAKEEFDNLEIGGRNLALNTAGVIVDRTETPDGSRYEYFAFDLGRALPFGAGTPIVISFDLYMPIKSGSPRFLVYNTNRKGPHQTLFDVDVLSGKDLPVGSIVDERIVIKTSVYADRSDSTLPNDYLEFYSNYGSNNYYRISNLKLEKGNKATDWTPAPEDIEARVSSAESAITQNAQSIELKVSKDGVISSINQSAETVKIQASRVEIDGTAVFSAISSDVDDAITSKGYQTSSQVNSAITSKGYATTTQAQGYASTAKSEAISAAATDAATKASNMLASAKSYADAIKQTVSDWVLDPMFSTGADKFAGVVLNATPPATLPSGCTSCGMLTTRDHASGIQHYGKAGHKLRVHYWCYCVPDSGSTVSPSKMGVGFLAPTANNYADVAKTSASGKWFEFSAVKIVPANTTSGWAKLFIQQETASGTTNTGRWYITGLTVEDVTESAAAMDVANAAAPKANAIKRTQRIWYRTNASSAPSTPGTASSNWVTKADDGNDAWTKMHIAINSTHKHIYTCEQYEMANGTVGYTSVLLDNTITVIDGGNIITGSVTANKLNAANINASKTLTVGAMTDAAASTILNSNVQVGGRNLLQETELPSSENVYLVRSTITDGVIRTAPTTSDAYADWKVNYLDYAEYNDGEYTVSVDARLSASGNGYTSINSRIYLGYKLASRWGGTFSSNYDRFTSKSISGITNEWNRVSVTFKVPDDLKSGQASALVAGSFLSVEFYCGKEAAAVDWRRPKLEKGNKATDWIPAPEDQTAYVDDSVSSIQVGGRNLLLRTATLSDTTYWWRSGITSLTENKTDERGGSDAVLVTPSTTSWYLASTNDNTRIDDIGGQYVASVWMRADTETTVQLCCRYLKNDTDLYSNNATRKLVTVTTEWQQFAVAGKMINNQTSENYCVWVGQLTSVPVYVSHFQLERGNKATDWTPAPEDTTASVDQTYVQNLTPYFSMSMTQQSDDYWGNLTYERFTQLEDGWAHFEYTNTGSSVANNYIYNKAINSIAAGSQCTLLIEFRNVSISADGGSFYSQQNSTTQIWGTEGFGGFSLTNAEIRGLANGKGLFRKTLTLLDAESKDKNGTVRGTLPKTTFMGINQQVQAGQTVSYDIRLSVYEGVYTGSYKPYSGDILFATNSALTGTNESLEGAIADIGELSDQLVDTTTEQNKTITDIQKYLNSLRQDLDAEIQSRQQWLNFNSAEGLIIGATGSTFKTVTTNTSQQFRSGGTVLAETSGTEFVAPVMRSDQILIGNWMWTRRDNGNLSLKWIG